MSTFKVEMVAINSIMNHPGADRLEIACINGWQCVIPKGSFSAGDAAVYLPIDSILPMELELKLFPPESKIKLNKSRIRTIKLRGAISQGMLVNPRELGLTGYKVGDDLTVTLGVTKYEPPVAPMHMTAGKKSTARAPHPDFRKYTGIENAKNYTNVFAEGETVVVTEKIHGTNFRAGYVPFHANTLWKKLQKFVGYAPSHEFVYGSHNVQLQGKLLYKGYYDQNVYAEAVVKYRLRDKLGKGQVVYGEIYGDGIQNGYTYGCKPGERKLILFDLMENGEYVSHSALKAFCFFRGLDVVPTLYWGAYDHEKILALREGASVYAPSQKVREGVVVRPVVEETCFIGRKILKFISDEYLLKDQTDFH